MKSSAVLWCLTGVALTAQMPAWTPVLKTGFGPFHEIALARTPDGTLHAVWRQQDADEKFSYWYAARGEPVRTSIRGWTSLSDPALTITHDGRLALLFGGARGSPERDHVWNHGSLYRGWDAPDFTLEEKEHSRSHNAARGPTGLAVAQDGTVWTGWPSYADYIVQRGLDKPPFQNLASGACCTYLGQLAADAVSGEVWAAWYSNAGAAMGLLVRRAAPDLGPLLVAPDTRGEYYGQQGVREPDQQLAFTGRSAGAGVFLAWCHGYPACTEIRLWQPGQPAAPAVLAKGAALKGVAVARAPEGRLWIIWIERGSVVTAVRGNKTMTKFTRAYTVAAPATYLAKVVGEGSLGPLDVFINTGSGILRTTITPTFDVQALLKALTLTVKVSDLGDPVPGAQVQYGPLTAVTNDEGSAVIELPARTKPAQVVITHTGYQKAVVTAVVQR